MRAGAFLTCLDALPFADIDVICNGKVMVLAPHPDDETLGCAGLIAEACRLGRPPIVVILSDGAASHPQSQSYPPERLRTIRAAEVEKAVAILGLPPENLKMLGLPDTHVPRDGTAFDTVVADLADVSCREGCGTICASWQHDPHIDHEATDLIARAVARVIGARLLSYPVWGWFLAPDMILPDQTPRGWRLNIEAHLGAKRRAIAAHESQYGGLITDDPTGFRFPAELLGRANRSYEVYLSSL